MSSAGQMKIELLLDAERPQVLEQCRSADELEVGLVGKDVPPVVDVEDRGEYIRCHLSGGIPVDEGSRDGGGQQDQDQCGYQAPRATQVEPREVNPARSVQFLQDQ